MIDSWGFYINELDTLIQMMSPAQHDNGHSRDSYSIPVSILCWVDVEKHLYLIEDMTNIRFSCGVEYTVACINLNMRCWWNCAFHIGFHCLRFDWVDQLPYLSSSSPSVMAATEKVAPGFFMSTC